MDNQMTVIDWDTYYKNQGVPEIILRSLMAHLASVIRKYCDLRKQFVIAELGGGNSFLYQPLGQILDISEYHMLDNNELSLELFRKKTNNKNVFLHNIDLLKLQKSEISADLVISTGLIEHFTPEDTKRCVEAHFLLAKPGAIVIISFPTPSVIYRSFRYLLEKLGKWPISYERPLLYAEVSNTISKFGCVLHYRRIFSTILTQMLIVARKQ